MATLNFYLDKADKNGKCFILMTYLAGGQKFRHSIKLKVHPLQWLKAKQRLKVRSMEDEFVNGHLDNLEGIIKEAQSHSLLYKHGIDFNYVRQKFNDSLGKKDTNKTFLEFFDEYIQSSRTTKGIKTTHRYITCSNYLKAFRKAKRYELTFERINPQFYDAFVNYLISDKGLLNNTVGNAVKTLKSFINYCTDKGYCKQNQDLRKFKVFKEDSELVALTEAELFKVFDLELLTDKLKVVRDNFCFACFTGLRYSDIAKLKAENIKGDYVEVTTQKTRDFLRIPLNVYAKEIINRNNGSLPRLFSNQKTNDYLKEIGKLAELNEMVQVTKYSGIEKIETIQEKHKFLTSHAARRTFVTLSLEKGMRPETVMSITGHHDYKTFKKYIKLTDKVKLTEMNNVWSNNLRIA